MVTKRRGPLLSYSPGRLSIERVATSDNMGLGCPLTSGVTCNCSTEFIMYSGTCTCVWYVYDVLSSSQKFLLVYRLDEVLAVILRETFSSETPIRANFWRSTIILMVGKCNGWATCTSLRKETDFNLSMT